MSGKNGDARRTNSWRWGSRAQCTFLCEGLLSIYIHTHHCLRLSAQCYVRVWYTADTWSSVSAVYQCLQPKHIGGNSLKSYGFKVEQILFSWLGQKSRSPWPYVCLLPVGSTLREFPHIGHKCQPVPTVEEIAFIFGRIWFKSFNKNHYESVAMCYFFWFLAYSCNKLFMGYISPWKKMNL